ncbi:MAG: redoxin domain-containing protein [Anaerolineaceae bacterium]|nr:redoxin domain-containing protein [Anaerolineaceae bacterium]
MSQTAPKLVVGMTAPAFQTLDLFDRPINLADYKGRWLLLSFYRNAACAICNLRVHQLIGKYAAYQEKGLDMLAVFESPKANTLQYVGRQGAPFPIIGDAEARLYDLYGVETSAEKVKATMADAAFAQHVISEASAAGFELTEEEGSNFYRMPADFLIDPDGNLREVFYSDLVGKHIDLETVERYLNAQMITT